MNIFYKNLWIFSKNYLKIFKFYETYKSREIFGEFYYLVEKFAVAAKGLFRGERSGHEKPIKHPPQGVRGAMAPRTESKFPFWKRLKVFENEFIFQKCQHFSSAKDPFFHKKIYVNWIYFTRIYEFFAKLFEIFQILWNLKSRKIFGKFFYLVEKFTVAAKGIFRGERSGHVKPLKHPPQGVRGAKAPRTESKFPFWKRFKVFENEFIFQKFQPFSSQKYPFFLRKVTHILQEFLNFFE